MTIPLWLWYIGYAAVVVSILAVLYALYKLLPRFLLFLVACVGFYFHLRAAKLYNMPRGPIWAHAPHHVWRAYQNRLDYQTGLRFPDIEFNYRYGIKNLITKNDHWLDEIAAGLSHGAQLMQVTITRDGQNRVMNEHMDVAVGVLPEQPDYPSCHALLLQPQSNAVEAVIGFDLVRLMKTVNHYSQDIQVIAVMAPRSTIEMRNTIEYLSTCKGIWADIDLLLFELPPREKEAV